MNVNKRAIPALPVSMRPSEPYPNDYFESAHEQSIYTQVTALRTRIHGDAMKAYNFHFYLHALSASRVKSWVALALLNKSAQLLPRSISSTNYDFFTIFSWIVIAFWAALVTAPYLNFDETIVPFGREYLSAIQSHYLWIWLKECGSCAMWNGTTRGGAPTLVDVHGSMLHPLVMFTTLAFGVLTGSKIALWVTFAVGGYVQWWLGRVLEIGRWSTLWMSLMGVASGHLSGRMELGAFGVVLSTVSCTAALIAAMQLALKPSWSNVVISAITGAIAIVSGQGYMQAGAIALMPALALIVPWGSAERHTTTRRFAIALCISLLLSSPLLVPFIHFFPNFIKDSDASFKSAQALNDIPLNLVIKNVPFFKSELLGKFPYPHLYVNYVGWIAVILSTVGIFCGTSIVKSSLLRCMMAFIFLAFWFASAGPLTLVNTILPGSWIAQQVSGIRHPPQISGLAIPFVLGLAAVGLEWFFSSQHEFLGITFDLSSNKRIVSIKVVYLIIPVLIYSLLDVYSFSREWISTVLIDKSVSLVIQELKTPQLQWVNPPFGEHFWIESAIRSGLKMNSGIRTWNWKDRPNPASVLEANRTGPPPGMTPFKRFDGLIVYAAPDGNAEYASILNTSGIVTACFATGLGGNVTVKCKSDAPGTLIVKENVWSGWNVTVNGVEGQLDAGRWLSVRVPAGEVTAVFRYRPWDVPVGLLLLCMGLGFSFVLWRRG